jgi:hypothetical protein
VASESTAGGGHRKLSLALVVIAGLITFVAIFSIWANRQALNTDNWVNTSGRLLANKKVEERLADYLGQQVAENVNVKGELEAVLPPRLDPLAAAAAGGINQLTPRIAERALESPKLQALWATANRLAHERLLEVLDGGGSTVSTENGEVTLDLKPLVSQIGSELGVGAGLGEKLPADAGKLTILKSDQLEAAQKGANLVRELPIFLTLLALILFAVAIWIAGPARRRTLRSVGFAFVIAGLLVLILRKIGGNVLVDSVVANPTAKPAVHAVWDIATSLLATVATSALALGILVVIAAWLAGPTRFAVRLRREAAPYVRDQRAAVWGAGFLVFLLLIALAPVAAFGKPLGILILAVLMAIGIELLARQTVREFPDART